LPYQAGLVQHTDTFPSKKVHDIDGQKVVLLCKSLCDVLLAQPVAGLPASDPRTVLKPDLSSVDDKPDAAVAVTNPDDAPRGQGEQEEVNAVSINAAGVFQTLARMMQQGSGSWLVSPVTREGDYLLTSDKALDRMTKDHPHLTRFMLMTWLRMNSALDLRNNKIFLHAPVQGESQEAH